MTALIDSSFPMQVSMVVGLLYLRTGIHLVGRVVSGKVDNVRQLQIQTIRYHICKPIYVLDQFFTVGFANALQVVSGLIALLAVEQNHTTLKMDGGDGFDRTLQLSDTDVQDFRRSQGLPCLL